MTARSAPRRDASARAAALLAWYQQHGRQLPWRRPEGQADPYAVLVSELMLQQTRVDTVKPYFARWMARWPTLSDLAEATLDDVLAAWTGLGYYNRARNLHRAAGQVVAAHAGRLPRDAKLLAALPGVGPYTQGALRSIAFGEAAALVDGNVARVFTRWQASFAPPAATQTKRAHWALAAALIQTSPAAETPGDWNQALMELGATVCTARAPTCGRCPVRPWCMADAQGVAAALPVRAAKKRPTTVLATYLLWQRRDGAVWCGRRPLTGRWAGLWEPPGAEAAATKTLLRGCISPAGAAVQQPPLVHILTHRRYEVTALWVRSDTPPPDLSALGYTSTRWISPQAARAANSGLSRLASRLIERCDDPPSAGA